MERKEKKARITEKKGGRIPILRCLLKKGGPWKVALELPKKNKGGRTDKKKKSPDEESHRQKTEGGRSHNWERTPLTWTTDVRAHFRDERWDRQEKSGMFCRGKRKLQKKGGSKKEKKRQKGVKGISQKVLPSGFHAC